MAMTHRTEFIAAQCARDGIAAVKVPSAALVTGSLGSNSWWEAQDYGDYVAVSYHFKDGDDVFVGHPRYPATAIEAYATVRQMIRNG